MKIGFIGKENAVRSVMAEVLAKKLLADMGLRAEVFSAGVEPAEEIHPLTLEILQEANLPTEGIYPKPLSKIPYKKLDVVVMVSNEAKERCEFVLNHKRRENWVIDEPAESREAFKKVFEQVEENLKELFKISS